MKLDEVCNKNDEMYTPPYAVKPILEFLKPNSFIWMPFDTDESWFKKCFLAAGHEVGNNHIFDGHDFFELTPPRGIDYIISNPPYSKKNEVFERLFKLDIPFAMLVGVVGLFESKHRFNLFKNNKFEILYFDKRINFMDDMNATKTTKSPPFSSAYLCHNILPEQIMFRELNKPKLGAIL